MENFHKYFAAMTMAAMSLIVQAKTSLELDIYGPQGSDPYAVGVPWELKGTRTYTTAYGDVGLGQSFYEGKLTALEMVIVPDAASMQSGVSFFYLAFSADKLDLGVPLDLGAYLGAQQFPFNDPGHPGLYFSDSGISGALNGQFGVFDLKLDAQGMVKSFAASFTIFGEPAPSSSPPWIGGRIWYNSDVDAPAVPEPDVGLLAICGGSLVAVSRLRSKKSRRS
jgi:hypothetical protein